MVRRSILLLCALLVGGGAQGQSQGGEPIAAAITGALARGATPGAVYLGDHGGQEVILALGLRARVPAAEPMTDDTRFDIASLTKVVATLPSVMRLMEQGKVRLDEPVRTYLPECASGEITVRQLLTHTSGLPAGLPATHEQPPWRGYAEGVRRACACLPDPAPGRMFRYSDVNFILLGEIVRRLSGETLDVFARREVFQPLGMTDTGFLPESGERGRIAPTQWDPEGGLLRGVVHDPTARRMGGVAGHAGLFSTVRDLARYARFILRGGSVLTPATRHLMCEVQTPADLPDRRGLGWDIRTAYSRPRGGLYGPDSFGHTGFTGAALWMDPVSDSFFILLTNRLHPDGQGNVKELYAELGTLTARWAGLSGSETTPSPLRHAP